jgi:hypothetical protein
MRIRLIFLNVCDMTDKTNAKVENKEVKDNIEKELASRKGNKEWRRGEVNENETGLSSSDTDLSSSNNDGNNSGVNGSRIVWAIFLVFFGSILLSNTTGLIEWTIWGVLWRFWPVMIILIGIKIILGRSLLMNILIAVLSFAAFSAITIVSLIAIESSLVKNYDISIPGFVEERFFNAGDFEAEEFVVGVEDYPEVSSRDLRIELGAAKFSIKDSSIDDYLFVDAYYSEGFGKPDLSTDISDQKLMIDFDLMKKTWVLNFGMRTPEYDFVLGQSDVATDLDVNVGAGKGTVQLNEVNLKEAAFEVGAGDIEIDINDVDFEILNGNVGQGSIVLNLEDAEIEDGLNLGVGAGSIKLWLPDDYGYSINYELGVGSINTPKRDVSGSSKGTILSLNYDEADVILDIELKVGLGSFEINR